MKHCRYCGNEIPHGKFCNTHCYTEYRYQEKLAKWKAGLDNGMRGATALKHFIRRYLFEKYHSSCARCGWHEINPVTGKSPLEVEHIDGNHENNCEENLILLCPNCHSLTPTYKSLNKGHGRNRRKYNDRYKKVWILEKSHSPVDCASLLTR